MSQRSQHPSHISILKTYHFGQEKSVQYDFTKHSYENPTYKSIIITRAGTSEPSHQSTLAVQMASTSPSLPPGTYRRTAHCVKPRATKHVHIVALLFAVAKKNITPKTVSSRVLKYLRSGNLETIMDVLPSRCVFFHCHVRSLDFDLFWAYAGVFFHGDWKKNWHKSHTTMTSHKLILQVHNVGTSTTTFPWSRKCRITCTASTSTWLFTHVRKAIS